MTHWLIQLAPLQHFIEKRQHLFHEKNKYKFCFSKVKHQVACLGQVRSILLDDSANEIQNFVAPPLP